MPERRALADPAVQQALGRKRQKYNARRTEVDGIVFDSAKEARRYQELKLLEKAGEIRGLRRQVSFDLMVVTSMIRTYKVGEYVADFTYTEPDRFGELRRSVVEDVKGICTPLYRWKKKHVEAQYGIEIREV